MDYLKNEYSLHQIGGGPSLEKNSIIDESQFLHDDSGRQIWVVRAIDKEDKDLRLDIINGRTQANLKTFVVNHIAPGTHLVHDGWVSYTFLDSEDSVYTDEEHNHGAGNFGEDLNSTSYLEGVWSWIKSEIKFLYRIMPHNRYIYSIKESEYKYILSKLTKKQRENHFYRIPK